VRERTPWRLACRAGGRGRREGQHYPDLQGNVSGDVEYNDGAPFVGEADDEEREDAMLLLVRAPSGGTVQISHERIQQRPSLPPPGTAAAPLP
jgi:hypothetical protein